MAPIRYLDVETTGLHREAELLEIAIVNEHGTPLLDTLVRPTRERAWPDAEEIHGITPEDVAAAPSADELTERIADALQGAELVTYNAAFDVHFVPAAAHTWSRVHCAMQAFSSEFGDWDDYHGDRRFVSLAAASAHVLCPAEERHRALGDALLCRAVWRYLTEPAERARVAAAHAERGAREQARWDLDAGIRRTRAARDREQQRQTDAWMRWLRFPLWMSPASRGRSALEHVHDADAYLDDVTRLFTGVSRVVHEQRLKHARLPVYRRLAEVPKDLVPLSQLQLPRWAREYVRPHACYVGPSGNCFRLLYRTNALEKALARHPLRRPFSPPAAHALYTRTQLRAAGFTRAEISRLAPVLECQNRLDGSWYPLFCLPEQAVASRHTSRCAQRLAIPSSRCNMCSGDK